MSTPNDGGPAFAAASVHGQQNGMSLRDWLAGKCPATLTESACAYGMPLEEIMLDDERRAAFLAVDAMVRHEWADAMIAARQRKEANQ